MASVMQQTTFAPFPHKTDVFYKPTRRRSLSTVSSLDGTEDCSSVSSDSGSEPSSPMRASPVKSMLNLGSGRDLMMPTLSRGKSVEELRRHYASKLGIVPSQQAAPLPASRRVSCLPDGYEPVIEKLKGGQAECYGGFLKLMRRSSKVGVMLRDDKGATPIACCAEPGCAHRTAGVSGAGSPSLDQAAFPAPGPEPLCAAQFRRTKSEGAVPRKRGGLKRGPSLCPGRRLAFVEAVKVVHIPSHEDYSRRIRDSYWSCAEEIYESACRNLIEFEYEGHAFEQAVEEANMILCHSGELVHPAHFEFAAASMPGGM